jgi:probable rRNA maturation factor
VTAPLRALIAATLALEDRRPGEISVLLTDDNALRELNRNWRGIDRATDVLSFGEPPGGRERGAQSGAAAKKLAIGGDLVISIDRVRAQARRYRVTPGRELARLVVHGTLHLAGHDHHRATERGLMRARERRVLAAAARDVKRLEAALRVK